MTSYDNSASYRTLTAFFRDRSDADRAVSRLLDAGIPNSNVRLVPGAESDQTAAAAPRESTGFWDALGDLFFPDDDRTVYAEGLRRGGYLVSVTGISETQHEQALDILDDEGTIDVDEWADSWRAEGWTGATASSTTSTDSYATSGMAGSDRSTLGAAGSTLAGSGMNTSGMNTTGYDASATARTGEDVIPLVEEQLKVGKRDVNSGRVRVRSYVVETPVSEQVSLRDENVSVERRAVDRPITDADTAFRDRTIEAEEHREEAVISKEARVREEVVLKKTAAERTERVEDKVRRTEIDIQDTRDEAALKEGLLGSRQAGEGQS